MLDDPLGVTFIERLSITTQNILAQPLPSPILEELEESNFYQPERKGCPIQCPILLEEFS